MGVGVGVEVAVGVGVAVGVAVAVACGVVVVAVGVPGRGVAVMVALSGRGVAVDPARAVPMGVATLGVGVPVAVPGSASLPPTACAARTWFWLPSRSSRPPPALPCSCERSDGRRDALVELLGSLGVATMPSGAFVRQPVVVSRRSGNAIRMPKRRFGRYHLGAMAKRYSRACVVSIGRMPIRAGASA